MLSVVDLMILDAVSVAAALAPVDSERAEDSDCGSVVVLRVAVGQFAAAAVLVAVAAQFAAAAAQDAAAVAQAVAAVAPAVAQAFAVAALAVAADRLAAVADTQVDFGIPVVVAAESVQRAGKPGWVAAAQAAVRFRTAAVGIAGHIAVAVARIAVAAGRVLGQDAGSAIGRPVVPVGRPRLLVVEQHSIPVACSGAVAAGPEQSSAALPPAAGVRTPDTPRVYTAAVGRWSPIRGPFEILPC